MTTEELIEELKKHPGKKVFVPSRWWDELYDADVSVAVSHPDVYVKWPGGHDNDTYNWHWPSYAPESVVGEEVLVIYG